LISISFEGQVHRMLTPEWSYAALSGAGAARQGGRANRQGVEALYTSLDEHTALREYQQPSPLMPPGTLITISVRLSSVIDFRARYVQGEWDPLWQDFFCDWRELRFNQYVEPPSWVVADIAMQQAKRLLFPSMAHHGGTSPAR